MKLFNERLLKEFDEKLKYIKNELNIGLTTNNTEDDFKDYSFLSGFEDETKIDEYYQSELDADPNNLHMATTTTGNQILVSGLTRGYILPQQNYQIQHNTSTQSNPQQQIPIPVPPTYYPLATPLNSSGAINMDLRNLNSWKTRNVKNEKLSFIYTEFKVKPSDGPSSNNKTLVELEKINLYIFKLPEMELVESIKSPIFEDINPTVVDYGHLLEARNILIKDTINSIYKEVHLLENKNNIHGLMYGSHSLYMKVLIENIIKAYGQKRWDNTKKAYVNGDITMKNPYMLYTPVVIDSLLVSNIGHVNPSLEEVCRTLKIRFIPNNLDKNIENILVKIFNIGNL